LNRGRPASLISGAGPFRSARSPLSFLSRFAGYERAFDPANCVPVTTPSSQRSCRLAAYLAVLGVPSLGLAQAAPATPTPASDRRSSVAVTTDANGDETTVLTPFEVSASSSVGYQATDTLAGTRIRTNLADVGSAISVATKEFMRDLGATNSESLLQFMTSTEVGGSQGNFLVGTAVGDSSTIDELGALRRPQSNTRVRGLDSADNTRDFFLTDIPWDAYNTSRIDLQRGANSILFGNGSGAGIINGAPDAASLARNSNSIGTRIASFGSLRGSINLNRVLIDRQLAIRVAALEDKQYYQQKPAFNHDSRYYGALRFDPRFLNKGSAHTSLKLSFEHGHIDANRPRLTTINDTMFPWFIRSPIELRSPTALGRPADRDPTLLGVLQPMISHDGYDPFVTNINTASLISGNPTRQDIGARQTISATNPNAEAWLGALVKPTEQGGSQQGGSIDGGGLPYWMAIYSDPSSGTISNYLYPSVTTYDAVNASGVRDGSNINLLRGPDLTALTGLPQYASRGIGSLLYALQGVWRNRTITDPSVFDFYNKLIDGPNKHEGSGFHAFNVALDQTFFNDRVGFQLAYDRQQYADFQQTNLGNPTLGIEIYKYLPVAIANPQTGVLEPVLNPNFGRPYVISKPRASRGKTDRYDFRFTPYVELDFKALMKRQNLVTKVLGRHTVNGAYEVSNYERVSSSWVPYTLSADQALSIFGPNVAINSSSRAVGTKTYLGSSLAAAASPAGANLSAITAVEQPGLGSSNSTPLAWYFDSTYTSTASPGASVTPLALGLAPNQVGGNATTQSENPLAYAAWGTAPRALSITNSQTAGEHDLTTTWSQVKNRTTSRALVDQWSLLDNSVIVTAGMRKDRIDTYYPGDPSVGPSDPSRTGNRLIDRNTGIVNWAAPFSYASSPSISFTSPWEKTYGAVWHLPSFVRRHTPFGLQTSLLFNHSENFRPENRRSPITGDMLTPPIGRTREMGVIISTPNRKFSLKINWYETKVSNATLPDNGVINFMADEVTQGLRSALSVLYSQDVNNGTNNTGSNPNLTTNQPSAGINSFIYRPTAQTSGSSTNLEPGGTHWYPWQPSRAPTSTAPWTLQEWKDAEVHALASANAFMDSLKSPEAQALLRTWQIKPGDFNMALTNFGINPQTPLGVAVTGDTISRGTEIELFCSPVQNWDLTANVAKTFATRINLAGDVGDWLQNRWAMYTAPYTGPDGPGLLAGGLRWFSNGQGSANSGNARFGRNGYRYFSEFHSKEGVNVPEMRPWRLNLVTSYRFSRGLLKGGFAGASYRWEDRSVIGYGLRETTPELFVTTASGVQSATAAVGAYDISKPFYGPRESHFGAWVGYSRKLKFADWRVQLNVNNVGENTRLVPVTTNPDGTGAAYRIAQGMTWSLTNSFNF
jgi:hypothetical protein